MKKLSVKRAATLSCLFIFTSFLMPNISAQTCSGTSTLSGAYRFLATGNGCRPNQTCPVFPLGSLGIITFDGSGNLSGSDVHNVAGVSCTRTFTGAYTVASNCTGTLTQIYALPTCGPTRTLGDIAVAPDGSEILLMLPDNSELLTVDFRKQ